MIISSFHSIGARLNVVLVIMIVGFVTVGASATVFFGQMEREYGKQRVLIDQEQHLEQLRSNILASIVFLDEILFKGKTSVIPSLLAANEDTLSSFATFQANAEKHKLLNDIYLATENEPVVYGLRKGFYNAISLFRKGQVEAAKAVREDVLAKRLTIVNTFIDNSQALRDFDLIDQNKVIVSMRDNNMLWSLVIIVLTSAVCFLVLLFARRSITRPITTLVRTMERFSPENYETGVSLDVSELGNNEIGVLGRTFDEMAVNLQRNIMDREQIRKQLKDNHDRIETILSRIIDGIVVCSEDGTIETTNIAAARIFGLYVSDMIGKSLNSLLAGEDETVAAKTNIKPNILAETGQIAEFERASSSGIAIWVEIAATSVKLDNEEILIVSLRDITERKRAEGIIIASLAEKEILLSEIHHRVKNNLQVISGMLWFQENAENNTHTMEVLRDSRRRVMLMAQIHESLHRQDDLNVINSGDFITTLVSDMKTSSGGVSEHLSFHIDVDDVPLDADHANAYGQIVSELISNSLKHGFPNNQPGNVNVSLHRGDDGVTELIVADDGKGLPRDFDLQQTKTLGLQLVSLIAAKLGGEVKIDGSGGTRIQINFPEQPL